MFDHSKKSLREACGVSEERWRELKAMAVKMVLEGRKWSEAVEKLVAMSDRMSCLELVLLAMNVGELSLVDKVARGGVK